MSTDANGEVVAVVEGTAVVREKPQFIELRFETDFLSWDDYDLLTRWVVDGEGVRRRDLMAVLKKCYIGGTPIGEMPHSQIEPAAVELYLAIHEKANPGDGEGN